MEGNNYFVELFNVNVSDKIEKKNGQVLFPLRLAITGLSSTPGGAIEIAYILGSEETLRRLDLSIAQLESELQ